MERAAAPPLNDRTPRALTGLPQNQLPKPSTVPCLSVYRYIWSVAFELPWLAVLGAGISLHAARGVVAALALDAAEPDAALRSGLEPLQQLGVDTAHVRAAAAETMRDVAALDVALLLLALALTQRRREQWFGFAENYRERLEVKST